MNGWIKFIAVWAVLSPAVAYPVSTTPLSLLAWQAFDVSATQPIPREVTVADFASVTDLKKAALIIKAGKLVYRHYVWANRPPRYPAPPKYAALFMDAEPSLCDGATLMTRDFLASDGIQGDSFNFLVSKIQPSDPLIFGQNFELSGHTVARVKLEHGAAIIDPTFGFILITNHEDFSNATFANRAYDIFSIFNKPADSTLLLHGALQFYGRAAVEPAFVGTSNKPIVATMPTIRVPANEDVEIGSTDHSNEDLTSAFGGYANHIGFWYQSTEHVWRFAPEPSGTLVITFYLLSGDNPVLKTPLDVGVMVSEAKQLSIGKRPGEITITVEADRPFSIKFISKSVSARLLDAITVQHQVMTAM